MRCIRLGIIWCCWVLALVDGQLKPVVENEENHVIISQISKINRYRTIKNFITFFGNEDLGEGNSITASFQQRLIEAFNRPVMVAGSHIGSLKELFNERSLAVVLFNDINDPILKAVYKSFHEVPTIQLMFVYKIKFGTTLTTALLDSFFNWCNENQFHSVLLATKHEKKFEFWTYEMKAEMRVNKLSETVYLTANKQQLRKYGNMGQYKSLVAVYQSITDVFVINSTGAVTLSGLTGLLLNEFMCYVNGSMDILQMSHDVYAKEISQECRSNRCIDIGANLIPNENISTYSPWLMSTRVCLILPYERQISLSEFVPPFRKNTSMLTFSAFILVANAIIKRLVNPRKSLGNILYSSLRLTLGQTMTNTMFRRLGLPEKLIEISTVIYNLMIFSIISGSLSMALINGLPKPDIVDVKTFLDSGLRIMVSPEQMPYIFDHIPSELSDCILLVDKETRDQHMKTLNDSYAYVYPTHKWAAFDYIQKRLRKPKLRVAPDKLCGFGMNLRFHVRLGLPFLNVLKQFINTARETGLVKQWIQLGLYQAKRNNLIAQAPYDPPIQKRLSLAFFQHPLYFLALGILVSLLSFCLEIARMRFIRNTI